MKTLLDFPSSFRQEFSQKSLMLTKSEKIRESFNRKIQNYNFSNLTNLKQTINTECRF